MICSDCFNTVDVEDEEQKKKEIKDNEKDKIQFVVKKVKISLDKIRLVSRSDDAPFLSIEDVHDHIE